MLKNKAIGGVIWSAIDNLSNQLVAFIIGIVLARLLSPEQFGLIGMITIFIGISQVLINSGIGDALIRKKNIDDMYYNTAFTFNAVISLILYVILFFAAPFIADFYHKPILSQIVRLLSFTIILNAFTLVQRSQITREIKFKSLAKVSLLSSTISGIVAIVLAYYGYGVWSLVWMNMIASLITLIVFWKLTGWIPKFQFSKLAFKDMFGFGSRLMILGLIDTIYNNMYFLIIGKYYSAADLGQYTRAETFKRLPAQSLTEIVQRVTYPLLSKIQDENERLKKSYQEILKVTMLISILGMFVLSLIAEELTVILMGPQWAEAGEYLKILCYSGFFFPLIALNSNILKVKGESGKILKIGLYRKVFSSVLIFILIFHGLKLFLYAMIIQQTAAFIAISWYGKKLIDYNIPEQVKDFLPFLIIGVGTNLFVGFVIEEMAFENIFIIFGMKLMLSISFILLSLFLLRNKTFFFLIRTLRSLLNGKR